MSIAFLRFFEKISADCFDGIFREKIVKIKGKLLKKILNWCMIKPSKEELVQRENSHLFF